MSRAAVSPGLPRVKAPPIDSPPGPVMSYQLDLFGKPLRRPTLRPPSYTGERFEGAA